MAAHAPSFLSLLPTPDVLASKEDEPNIQEQPEAEPSADPTEPEPCEPELVAVVEAVQAALAERGLARSLAVARALIHHVYDGDVHKFRTRERKSVSLRRLSELVPVSAAALYRCLSVHEIWLRTRGHQWPKLGAAHYRAVESLLPTTQAPWLARAAANGWSAARLREAVLASGVRVADRGGRLPEHPVARLVSRLHRELGIVDSIAGCLDVHPDQRQAMAALADRLEEAAARCRSHAARLRESVRGANRVGVPVPFSLTHDVNVAEPSTGG